jgi:hypothetical protein
MLLPEARKHGRSHLVSRASQPCTRRKSAVQPRSSPSRSLPRGEGGGNSRRLCRNYTYTGDHPVRVDAAKIFRRYAASSQHACIGGSSGGSSLPPSSRPASSAPNAMSASSTRRSTASWITVRPAWSRPTIRPPQGSPEAAHLPRSSPAPMVASRRPQRSGMLGERIVNGVGGRTEHGAEWRDGFQFHLLAVVGGVSRR